MMKTFQEYKQAIFAPAPYSIRACQVGLGISALMTLWLTRPSAIENILPTLVPGSYSPVGPLALFGNIPPSLTTATVCWTIAMLAALLSAVGIKPRASTVVWIVCGLLVAGLSQARGTSRHWHHSLNPVFVMGLAFLGAGTREGLMGTRFPIAAVQTAIALIFASSGACKLAVGGLEWVFSDSMRNLLVTQYQVLDSPVPTIVSFITERPWAWKGAAAFGVLIQALPAVSLLFFHRPVIRAIFGLFFLVEIAGLAVVMGLSNFQWIPLVAFFIDWDFFLKQRSSANLSLAPMAWTGWATWTMFVMSINLTASALPPSVLTRFNSFPFTSYPMFCRVFPADQGIIRFEVKAPKENEETLRAVEHRLNISFYMHRKDPDPVVTAVLSQARELLRSQFPDVAYERVTLSHVIVTIPPPPADPVPLEKSRRILGVIERSIPVSEGNGSTKD